MDQLKKLLSALNLRQLVTIAIFAIAVVAACGTTPENALKKDERAQSELRDELPASKTLKAPAAPAVGGMAQPVSAADEAAAQPNGIPGGFCAARG